MDKPAGSMVDSSHGADADRRESLLYIALIIMELLACSYIVLWRLGGGNLNDWDEARHGASGYEMLMSDSSPSMLILASDQLDAADVLRSESIDLEESHVDDWYIAI